MDASEGERNDLLAARMADLGYGSARLAADVRRRCGPQCALDGKTVGRWLRRRQEPDERHQMAVCQVLGVPHDQRRRLGFRPLPEPARHAAEDADPFRGAAHEALVQGLHRFLDPEGTSVDRRLFLRLWAGLAPAVVLPLDVLERVADAFDDLSLAEPGLVDGLEAMTSSLVGGYFAGDPRELLPTARLHANALRRRLDEPLAPVVQRRLAVAFATTTYLAGRLAFVLDQRADALAYLALARGASAEVGDAATEAGVLNGLSVLQSGLPRGGQGGDPAQALGLLRQAADVASGGTPAHIQGWIAARTSYESAAVGDAAASLRAQQVAERHLERADTTAAADSLDAPAPVIWDARANLAAAALASGAPPADVAVRLASLLRATPMELGRRRAILQTDLAAVSVAAGDLDEACGLMGQAWSFAVGSGYRLGRQRVRGVRSRLRPWDGERVVRELDERMAVVAAGTGA